MNEPENSSASPKDGTTNMLLKKLLDEGSVVVERELGPAMSNVESGQIELDKELQAICDEMERITGTVGEFGVNEHVRKRLAECKESLVRTKRTLTTVNARLGRLRKYEDAQRLRRKDSAHSAASSQDV